MMVCKDCTLTVCEGASCTTLNQEIDRLISVLGANRNLPTQKYCSLVLPNSPTAGSNPNQNTHGDNQTC